MPILQTLTKIMEISGNTETLSNVSPNQMLLFLNNQQANHHISEKQTEMSFTMLVMGCLKGICFQIFKKVKTPPLKNNGISHLSTLSLSYYDQYNI